MTPWQRQGKNYRELCAANKRIKELERQLAEVDKVLHEAGTDSVRALHEACLAALERAERAERELDRQQEEPNVASEEQQIRRLRKALVWIRHAAVDAVTPQDFWRYFRHGGAEGMRVIEEGLSRLPVFRKSRLTKKRKK